MNYVCEFCGKKFPLFYINHYKADRGMSYWGNGQKYNFRGAKGNFLKHQIACERKQKAKDKK